MFLCITFSAQAQQTLYYDAILRSNVGTDTMWDGNTMRIYGITPLLSSPVVLPSRTIWCNEGDSVVINARSISQGEHHTIHLHGLDVDTRNDGDPATSFWLEHMQDTTYSFKATNAGTYLYHCHVGDVVHVQMGMYGLIVVRAANGTNNAWTGGPFFSKQYKWLMSEIDEQWHDSIPVHDDSLDQIMLPPYLPDYFLINGLAQQELNSDSVKITGQVNEPIYVRLANIGFYNNRVIFPASLNAMVVDSDGRPLPNTVSTDTVMVMPGERYGVMLSPSVQFTGTVTVEYMNMNTDSIWQTEYPPVVISGYYGVEEIQDGGAVSVFPNPASSVVYAESFYEIMSIIIVDMSGKEILALPVQGKQVRMDLDGILSNGNYIMKVKTEKGTTAKPLIFRK